MQKKVIALAVAGLVSGAAFAQTSVTLSGTVDLGYNVGKDKWESQTHKYRNFRGGDGKGMSSSRLNIDVKEQLGSGLKAGYFHEIGLTHFKGTHNDHKRMTVGDDGVTGSNAPAFSRTRQSFAYLESASAGRFQIGLANLIIDDQTGFANVGSRNHVGHAYNASFYAPGTDTKLVDAMDLARANTVSYYSPSFSGFQVMGQFGYGKSDLDNGPANRDDSYKIYNLGLKYANGPVTAFIGGQKYEKDASTSAPATSNEEDRREFIAAAGYDFGGAKLVGMYFDRKNDINGPNDHKYRGGDIGVKVPVGQAELFANYGIGKNKFTASGADSWKIQTYQLGTRYNLSKRTNVYALYGYGKAKEKQKGSGTGKGNVVSVGLRHSF